MFKKCTYFLILFFLYSATYGMRDLQQESFNFIFLNNPNYEELSPTAQCIAKVLTLATDMTPTAVMVNNKEDAELILTNAIIELIVHNRNITFERVIYPLWYQIKHYITLSNSKILEDTFKMIVNLGGKNQEEELKEALKDLLGRLPKVENNIPKDRNPNSRSQVSGKGKRIPISYGIPDNNDLNYIAKLAIQALKDAISVCTNRKDAKKHFAAAIIKQFEYPFTGVCCESDEELRRFLKEARIVNNKHDHPQSPPLGTKDSSKSRTLNFDFSFKAQENIEKDREALLDKEQNTKLKRAKTDTLNDKKESKIADNNDKKEESKKPTISQGFPFGKIIAITGILGIIAFLYHKHSKAQEYPAQPA